MSNDVDWSCWGCGYHKKGGTRFPLHCAFPAVNNPTRDKPIPAAFVDKGCKHFQPRKKKVKP